MIRIRCCSLSSFVVGLAIASPSSVTAAPIDFAHQIVPILRTHCGECHTGDAKKGGFSLNTRADLLAGGESGPAVVAGKSGESDLLARITSTDADLQMPPPPAKRVPAEAVALLKAWVDEGLKWEENFSFRPPSYEPPLRPRQVALPPAVDGRTNPIDRILDDYLTDKKLPRPQPIDDATFARRAYLDLVGLLPTATELDAFLADTHADKRARLVDRLLADDMAYAEHWLTFWNDLLRNDYAGTGFITGGRTQISRWLYDALVTNKPYDLLARELIAPPTPDSAGYAAGIKWRGDVSAGQTVEIQFAQSVGQTFLGINLKCASCHDSFIDRWKLDESYGLAAVYATKPLEIHRCDKPVGRQAQAAWLFPELGTIDAAAPQPERLKQLAALLTHKENGRFTRTIVNRFWHRLMGRGIVHPTDSMQSEPWNADLLDFLAADLAEHKYDLKRTLRLIANSQAYQSRVQPTTAGIDDAGYVYAGPRAKRLTAEQFIDAVGQLTGAAPKNFDAPILRGSVDAEAAKTEQLLAQSIVYNLDQFDSALPKHVTFRRVVKFDSPPRQSIGVLSADAATVLFVNGKQAAAVPAGKFSGPIVLTPHLRQGANALLLVVDVPQDGRVAEVLFEARVQRSDAAPLRIATDAEWQFTAAKPDARGRFLNKGAEIAEKELHWQPAALGSSKSLEPARSKELQAALLQGSAGTDRMVRASLLKSNFLLRSLGRPNREQIVSMRPTELTTLEAIDLSNGQILADALAKGGVQIAAEFGSRPDELIRQVFVHALSREPTAAELGAARELLGDKPTPQAVEDLLWAVLMLPEFMLVR
jgi:hypothetical protein